MADSEPDQPDEVVLEPYQPPAPPIPAIPLDEVPPRPAPKNSFLGRFLVGVFAFAVFTAACVYWGVTNSVAIISVTQVWMAGTAVFLVLAAYLGRRQRFSGVGAGIATVAGFGIATVVGIVGIIALILVGLIALVRSTCNYSGL
jgi:hypothetical protein